MNIGDVLNQAWKITWKYKVLWIYGILAGCGSTQFNSGSSGINYQFDGRGPSPFPEFERRMAEIPEEALVAIVFTIICLALVFFVISILLGTMGRIGLVQGTYEADEGATQLTFGGLFEAVQQYFWRVLGLNVLWWIILAVLFLVLAGMGAIIAIGTLGLALLCLIPLLCLLVPLGWFLNIIIEQANIALVVENLGVLDALERGWNVVRENLGPMVLMGLILIVIGVIAGIIFSLPFILIVFPTLFAIGVSSGEAARSSMLIAGLCFVAYLPVLIVLAGILQTYIKSSWTLTFLRLTRPPSPDETVPEIPSPESA